MGTFLLMVLARKMTDTLWRMREAGEPLAKKTVTVVIERPSWGVGDPWLDGP